MDLPIEIFLSFIGFSIVMGIVGIWRKVPFLMFIAGAMICFWAVTTDNIIMESFASNIPDNSTQIQSFNSVYHMNQTTSNMPQTFTSANTIRAEKVNIQGSALNGDSINCISMGLSRTLNPTGNVEIGIFDSSGITTKQFASIPASSLTTTVVLVKACLPSHDYWVLSTFDRIGAKHTTSTGTDLVSAGTTTTNTFDGTNTIRSTFVSGAWVDNTGEDMQMRLWNEDMEIITTNEGTTTIESNPFPFTEYPKILFSLMGSMFLIAGALIWKMDDN